MTTLVVDTNVVLVANGRHKDASDKCVVECVERLQAINERQARIVECRFYGGMSVEETADALNVSPATVKRDWAMARAWLSREMKKDRHGRGTMEQG